MLNEALDEGNIECLKIILKILGKFNEITEFKLDLLENGTIGEIDETRLKKFEMEYEKFSEFLFNCEEEYYSMKETAFGISKKKYFELLNNMSQKDKKAINEISLFLNEIILEYGLMELSYIEKEECGFNPSFIIKVPNDMSPERKEECWMEIFERVSCFSEDSKISFILDDLSIILRR